MHICEKIGRRPNSASLSVCVRQKKANGNKVNRDRQSAEGETASNKPFLIRRRYVNNESN